MNLCLHTMEQRSNPFLALSVYSEGQFTDFDAFLAETPMSPSKLAAVHNDAESIVIIMLILAHEELVPGSVVPSDQPFLKQHVFYYQHFLVENRVYVQAMLAGRGAVILSILDSAYIENVDAFSCILDLYGISEDRLSELGVFSGLSADRYDEHRLHIVTRLRLFFIGPDQARARRSLIDVSKLHMIDPTVRSEAAIQANFERATLREDHHRDLIFETLLDPEIPIEALIMQRDGVIIYYREPRINLDYLMSVLRAVDKSMADLWEQEDIDGRRKLMSSLKSALVRWRKLERERLEGDRWQEFVKRYENHRHEILQL